MTSPPGPRARPVRSLPSGPRTTEVTDETDSRGPKGQRPSHSPRGQPGSPHKHSKTTRNAHLLSSDSTHRPGAHSQRTQRSSPPPPPACPGVCHAPSLFTVPGPEGDAVATEGQPAAALGACAGLGTATQTDAHIRKGRGDARKASRARAPRYGCAARREPPGGQASSPIQPPAPVQRRGSFSHASLCFESSTSEGTFQNPVWSYTKKSQHNQEPHAAPASRRAGASPSTGEQPLQVRPGRPGLGSAEASGVRRPQGRGGGGGPHRQMSRDGPPRLAGTVGSPVQTGTGLAVPKGAGASAARPGPASPA